MQVKWRLVICLFLLGGIFSFSQTVDVRPFVLGMAASDVGGEQFSDQQQLNAELEEDSFVYLPLVMNCYPLIPYLKPIGNADGDGIYTLTWSLPSCGGKAAQYEVQRATNSQFSPAESMATIDTSLESYWEAVGTHYWRVRANVNSGWTGWSNAQSTVVGAFSYLVVQNDTGSTLNLEIFGVEKRAFPAGFNDFWRSIPVGNYTVAASARCGSMTEVEYFPQGAYSLRYYCGMRTLSADSGFIANLINYEFEGVIP